ncbi:ATP-binding cassette, subfamily C, CydCD [Frankineae bacterium MT45]|nr:ATP-binding cassette, subfamily C, CydCD [Frankineae bacterium MT45]
MSRPVDPRLLAAVPATRRLLLQVAVLQLVAATATVAQTLLLSDVIVRVFQGSDQYAQVLQPLLLLLGAGLLRAASAVAQERVAGHASVTIRRRLRQILLTSVVRLGPDWSQQQAAGRLVTAAGAGLESLDGYLTRALPALVSAATVPVIIGVCIAWADWQSALILLVTLPLVPIFMILVGVSTRRRMQQQYATLARLCGHFLDLLQGLTTLKVYGQAGRQSQNVHRGTELYRRQTMSTLRVAFLSGLVLDLIATLSLAVIAVDVGLRLDHGSLQLGTALVVLLLAPELFAPLRALGAQYHASEEGQVAASAALEIIDAADEASPESGDSPVTGEPVRLVGGVEVQDLVVRHEGRSEAALAGVSLDARAGEVLVVEGVSGGGKSTLLGVLTAFRRADGGAVRVQTSDGWRALHDLDPLEWRENIAWVPQRPCPTQPDVAAEVALGDPQAGAAAIAQAIADCRAPAADTPLGEDGAQISAGQRRRVALARALLRARRVRADGGVPLLLLDEPSEDLDTTTEGVVAALIGELAGWATVVVVTHSEALARLADQRITLSQGRVVDQRQIESPQVMANRGLQSCLVSAHHEPNPPVTSPPEYSPLIDPGPEPAGHAGYGLLQIVRGSAARWRLLQAALLGAGSGLAGLALTATSMWLICRASQQPNVQALEVAVVGVRAFALARALLRYAERLASHDGALRLLADVRARVFESLQPLAPAGLRDLRRGDLLRRFIGDVDGVQEGLVRAVIPMAGAVLTAAGAATLAALLDPAAGLVLAALLLLALLVGPTVAYRVSADARPLSRSIARRDTQLGALLDGIGELTAYGAADRALNQLGELDADVARRSGQPIRAAAGGTGVVGVCSAVALPAVLAVAAVSTSHGRLDPIAFGVLAVCVLAGFDAVAGAVSAVGQWRGCLAGLDRVTELLARPAPVAEPIHASLAPAGGAGMHAGQLTLCPAPGAASLLDGVELSIRPGTRTAIIGPSGSGKSTLLTAALRLLPIQGGELSMEGADTDGVGARCRIELAAMRSDDVPPVIAGSLQGDHVFDATLRDNLRVVRPQATDDELDLVAERAGLSEFIAGLPQGWSTPAGADGAFLSGGQRQRLLLARAFLAAPQILILDEPTAHLDRETEEAVLQDLLLGSRGETLLMSTHRALRPHQVDQVLAITDRQLQDVTAAAVTAPGEAADVSFSLHEQEVQLR